MRAMELGELERRLASEQNAKYRVNQQLDSSAATTADLAFRLNQLTAAFAAQAQQTQDAANLAAAAAADTAAAADEEFDSISDAPNDVESETALFRSAFQAQTLRSMEQGTQIDRLTQALETTQRTLLLVIGTSVSGGAVVPPTPTEWVPPQVPPKASAATTTMVRIAPSHVALPVATALTLPVSSLFQPLPAPKWAPSLPPPKAAGPSSGYAAAQEPEFSHNARPGWSTAPETHWETLPTARPIRHKLSEGHTTCYRKRS